MEKGEILNCIRSNLNKLTKEELLDIIDEIETAHNEAIENRLKIYEVPFTGYFKVAGNFLVKAETPEKAKEILKQFGPTEFSCSKWWDFQDEELIDREIGEPVEYGDQDDTPEYDQLEIEEGKFADLYFKRIREHD